MSSIAQNPDRGATGKVSHRNLDNEFQSEVSQALALKLDLKTRQHANDKMLTKLIRSGGKCSALKQAVQARAAIYGEWGEAAWFVSGQDISAKARTLIMRRSVRAQLIAAPLVVAQAGLHRLRVLLGGGDSPVLNSVRLGDHYSVAETLKMLSSLPPLSVLKLLDQARAAELASLSATVAEELDFVQSTVDLVAAKDSLNPSMHAVAVAFKRRHLTGRFSAAEHNIKVDTLVYADTKGKKDFDHCATDIIKEVDGKKNPSPRGRQMNVCLDSQRGYCRWRNCRFDHSCAEGGRRGHGRRDCWLRSSPDRARQPSGSGRRRQSERVTDTTAEVPPHPRRRSDRPNNS